MLVSAITEFTVSSHARKAVLWSDFFNRQTDGNTPFSEGLLADLVPTCGLAANLTVPVEHDVHRLRLRNYLGRAVNLYIIRAVELFTKDQQGYLRITPDVLDFVGALARRDCDPAVVADHRGDQASSATNRRACAPPARRDDCALETLERRQYP